MSYISAGANISANMSPGRSPRCTPADHLTTQQHIPCLRGVVTAGQAVRNSCVHLLYVLVSGQGVRGVRLRSVCVFADVRQRVVQSDGCWGKRRLGGGRLQRLCVIDGR